MAAKKTATQLKFAKIMKEYNAKSLHSGSKTGPIVTNPRQAKAIAIHATQKK